MDTEETSLDNKAQQYFKSLLDRNITSISAETNMMATLDPGRKGSFKHTVSYYSAFAFNERVEILKSAAETVMFLCFYT